MKTLVGFKPVSAVPVAACVYQRFGPVDLGFDQQAITEEQAYSDDSEDDVDFGSQDTGFLEYGVVGGYRFVLSIAI